MPTLILFHFHDACSIVVPADLQRSIDAAAEFCEQAGLVSSVDKTKVVERSLQLCQGLSGGFVVVRIYIAFSSLSSGVPFLTVSTALPSPLASFMSGAWAQLRQQWEVAVQHVSWPVVSPI